MKPARTAAAFLVLVAAPRFGGAAGTLATTYTVSGSDVFAIGSSDIRSEVSYRGTETLGIGGRGRLTRLRARVAYTRTDGAVRTRATAQYVADVSESGETAASANDDPDNLTVLNQPFAARLDAATLHDLVHLRGPLPFDFPSPFTRSTLHGYLQHLAGSTVSGRRAVGVRFEAAGAMHGALPERPGVALAGTIAMRGTAFYDAVTAVLLALDTTVTVSGKVSDQSRSDPVKIVYVRTIKAEPPGPRTPAPARRAPDVRPTAD